MPKQKLSEVIAERTNGGRPADQMDGNVTVTNQPTQAPSPKEDTIMTAQFITDDQGNRFAFIDGKLIPVVAPQVAPSMKSVDELTMDSLLNVQALGNAFAELKGAVDASNNGEADVARMALAESGFMDILQLSLEDVNDADKETVAAAFEKATKEHDVEELQRLFNSQFLKAVSNEKDPVKRASLLATLGSAMSKFTKFTSNIITGAFGFTAGVVKLVWSGMKWVAGHIKKLVVGVGTFLFDTIKGFLVTSWDNIVSSFENYKAFYTNTVVTSWNTNVVPNAVAFGNDFKNDFPTGKAAAMAVGADLIGKFKAVPVQ